MIMQKMAKKDKCSLSAWQNKTKTKPNKPKSPFPQKKNPQTKTNQKNKPENQENLEGS